MKHFNPILLLLISSLISCSSDDDARESIMVKELVAITKSYYEGNTNFFTETYNFFNDRLINIQYSDNSYDDIYYEGDLISRILEFNANNEWEWTVTYVYDNQGRLIKKEVVPSPFNTITAISRQKTFDYNGEQIESENSWSDGGLSRNSLTVNNDNVIVEDRFVTEDGDVFRRYLYGYTNGNMTALTLKDANNNSTVESTYQYLDKAVTKPYQMGSLLFGNAWKNNQFLNYQFGLSENDSFEFSANYIESFSSQNFATNISTTGTFSYKFDSDHDIIEQVYIKSSSTGSTFRTITTYQYK